jgi:hypothetical protein
MKCILCEGEQSEVFFTEAKAGKHYYRCALCDLRFLDPARRLNQDDEKARYQTHENRVIDPRYQEFQRPMVTLIQQAGPALEVLDFGCGGGPVIQHLLEPCGYKVNLYDPYFYPDRSVLGLKYDFVAAVEVVEHLYHPAREFALLRSLVKEGGRLGIMTEQCSDHTDFSTWHYRRDPTHVAFYSEATLRWMAQRYAFNEIIFHSERLAEFL